MFVTESSFDLLYIYMNIFTVNTMSNSKTFLINQTTAYNFNMTVIQPTTAVSYLTEGMKIA